MRLVTAASRWRSSVRYNVCPTTNIDTIVGHDGERTLVPMRWGLVPRKNGLVEWQDTSAGKQPWYFTVRDSSPALTVAGVCTENLIQYAAFGYAAEIRCSLKTIPCSAG